MRNILLTIQYDGTNYQGWQFQKNGPSIQQKIKQAIKSVTGENATLLGASRTDSGVHAYGQAANFSTRSKISIARFPHAINHYLPSDIAVLDAKEVTADFNARKMSIGKLYKYFIFNNPIHSPLKGNFSWHIRGQLDLDLMVKVAQLFVGFKDFRSYCAETERYKDTRRFIGSCVFKSEGPDITFEIYADGFLYNMVRRIVGTLVSVGKGKIKIEHIIDSLSSNKKVVMGPTAPPQGLFLWKVYF